MSDTHALREAASAFLACHTWKEYDEAQSALEAAGYEGETGALALPDGLIRTRLDPELMERLGLEVRPVAPAPETKAMPVEDLERRRQLGRYMG